MVEVSFCLYVSKVGRNVAKSYSLVIACFAGENTVHFHSIINVDLSNKRKLM